MMKIKLEIINNEENFISSTMSSDMTLDVHNSVSSFPGFGGFFISSCEHLPTIKLSDRGRGEGTI